MVVLVTEEDDLSTLATSIGQRIETTISVYLEVNGVKVERRECNVGGFLLGCLDNFVESEGICYSGTVSSGGEAT